MNWLDNLRLGYGGTKEEMQRLIDDANAYAEANGLAADLSIDSFADIVQAIQYIQEEQNIAGTTAKEAASTIEGSINTTKAAWQNLLTELGKDDGDVTARVQELVDSATAVLENVTPVVQRVSQALVEAAPQLIPAGVELGKALLQGIADGIAQLLWGDEGVGKVVEPIGGSFEKVQEAIGDPQWLVDAGNAIRDIATAARDFVQAFAATADIQGMTDALTGFATAFGEAVGPLPEGATDAEAFGIAMGNAFNALATAIDVASSIIGPAVEVIRQYIEPIVSIVEDIGAVFNDVIMPIADTVAETVAPVFEDLGISLDDLGGKADGMGGRFSIALTTLAHVFTGIRVVANATFPAVSGIVKAATQTWSTVVTTAMTGIRTVVSTATTFIRSSFDRLKPLGDTVRGIFNTVKSAITDPINTAKTAVSDAVTAIKNAINNCNVKFPHIDLPHFSVSGGTPPYGIGGKGTLPSFSVNWYAQGAWFKPSSPVIMAGFGDNRKYDEVALPLSPSNLARIGAGIAAASGAGGDINITLNYDAGADAAQMVRDIAHGLGSLRRAGAF